ncbi:MAG: extracellular solute-binding protein, partial [Caldilineaceae bacterium]|nr:extracellular solute-binding protein [Caldilineaceae bacterium]
MIKRTVSRRDFLALSGATAAGAALAACGPAAAPASEPDGGDMPAAEGYSIVYTYPHPDTNMLGGNQRLILERYDSMVPGTDVQVELKTGYEMSRVQADLAAGTAPDLFWAGYTSVIQAIDEGLIVNQQEYMEAAGVDFDDFVDGIEAIYAPPTVGGYFWGMPYEQVVVLFAYNVAALEESGMEPPPKDWTWDELIEWGVAVTRDVNGKRPDEDGFDSNEVDIWGVAYWQHFAIQEYLPWTAGQLYVDETRTKATI